MKLIPAIATIRSHISKHMDGPDASEWKKAERHLMNALKSLEKAKGLPTGAYTDASGGE